MALQVWLPLTKDLRNQGLKDVSAVVNGTTSFTVGKLGQALNCNGSSYWSLPGLTVGTVASIACWSKTSTNGKMQWVLESSVSDRLNLYESNIYTLNTGDSNNNPFQTDAGASINCLHDGEWHHFVVTWDGSACKLYIDGVYKGKAKTYRSPASGSSTRALKVAGGYGNAHSYDWNGAINDFRLYDHCLSPMEVKKLSQGLVLHYPLNDNFIQQMNNCYVYPRFETSSSSGGWSHWGRSGASGSSGQSTDSNYIYRSGQTYTHWVANASTATGEYLLYQSPAFEGGGRSLQCICKEVNGGIINESVVFPTWNARSGGAVLDKWTSITSLGNGFYLCKCEDIQQDGSNDLVGFYVRPGKTVYFSEAYLENDRECCSDIFYPTNIMYDTSGFCNNGTAVGTFTISSDTPKYNVSTKFSSNRIQCSGNFLEGLTTATLSAWVKLKSYHSERCMVIFANGRYLTVNSSGQLSGYSYGKTPAGYYNSTKTIPLNTWTYITIVWSDTTWYFYINGELVNSWSCTGTFTNSGGYISIGQEGNGGRSVNGQISDARVYATALSADDVKSLYQNCATIDPDGTIHGQIR